MMMSRVLNVVKHERAIHRSIGMSSMSLTSSLTGFYTRTEDSKRLGHGDGHGQGPAWRRDLWGTTRVGKVEDAVHGVGWMASKALSTLAGFKTSLMATSDAQQGGMGTRDKVENRGKGVARGGGGGGLCLGMEGVVMDARGYAKGRPGKPRAPINRPMGASVPLKIVFVSPGILVEPWKKEETLTWQSLLTVEGWRARWQRYFVNTGKSLFTLSKCMQGIPNFKLRDLKVELAQLYETINEAASKGSRKKIEENVTEKAMRVYKKELMDRKKNGWEKLDWKVEDLKLELMQGRVVQVAPEVQFAQLTCKISSKQSLAAYDASGNIVAGSVNDMTDVSEYWVFERGLGKKLVTGSGIRWRLAARL
ncbi:hypothetical protein HOP50_15g74620 [Chloropicon primus]|uniref:Large ribosomal subunit protein mL45 n=2 Tax=Chloropicon primus TaxID=1764295 RepID=A0A5B8MWJ1_9CHLO|nr:hypothetical protein A3770_15p74370 [Chloropicon primus]UPR04128.1 hypothetical protein HOP50_15g74620 [Chloropicon primus]|eukprot:QDZ24919.1 hypothetical protein A3770_15p74370 [Chloropicon primus]